MEKEIPFFYDGYGRKMPKNVRDAVDEEAYYHIRWNGWKDWYLQEPRKSELVTSGHVAKHGTVEQAARAVALWHLLDLIKHSPNEYEKEKEETLRAWGLQYGYLPLK